MVRVNPCTGFFITACAFFAAFLLLVAVSYCAPLEMVLEHGPKLTYSLFAFALGMYVSLFVNKNGFRYPSAADIKSKLSAVIASLLICLSLIYWLNQVQIVKNEWKAGAEACANSTSFGEITEAQLLAERRSIQAAQNLNVVWIVRHPHIPELAPCAVLSSS